MSTPNEIRAQITRTRTQLSDDVDELGDKVSPGRIAHRQAGRVKTSATRVRNHVMGAADHSASAIGDAASSAQDAVGDAPRTVARQTQGNPIAAGLIAFGAGILVSSLFRASGPEAQAVAAVKEQAEPLVHEMADAAKEATDNLREPAQRAVDSVSATASEAAETVQQQAGSAAGDVRHRAEDAKDTIQQQASER
jgi:ElaB/YqjD/DUF883 family membrane-anchored ribosome-binding protein